MQLLNTICIHVIPYWYRLLSTLLLIVSFYRFVLLMGVFFFSIPTVMQSRAGRSLTRWSIWGSRSTWAPVCMKEEGKSKSQKPKSMYNLWIKHSITISSAADTSCCWFRSNRLVQNGKCTAFIQRYSNQWPLKAMYNIDWHSPINAHIHTPMARSAVQGDSQLIRSSQGEVPCSGTPWRSS